MTAVRRGTIGLGIGGHTHPTRGLTDVWLTPPAILAALGVFDLDPCACPEPRPWPTAHAHYAPPQDGLGLPWSGRIWCNPPYGPEVGTWLSRLADHGHGTALTFARTDTEWFRWQVAGRATAVLFIFGRLYFHRPDGRRADHNAGGPSVLVAYGENDAERLRHAAAGSLAGWFVRLSSGGRGDGPHNGAGVVRAP